MSDDEHETAKPLILDQKGMQVEGPYSNMHPAVMLTIIEAVTLGLGYLCAWGIYSLGPKADYDKKYVLLKGFDLAWFYLAIFVFTKITSVLQMFVGCGRREAHADNPDQYIFETKLVNQPYVRLVTDGAVGKFNRAQRGIDNFRELLPGVLANVLLAGFIFTKATFGLVCAVFVGRVLYSAGYIEGNFNRVPGMLIFMLSNMIISGLVFFSIIKLFMA